MCFYTHHIQVLQMNTASIRSKFQELYGAEGILFTSPGRINLIGEHTDYNGAFVFPGAVDKAMVAEIRLNGTDRVRAYALDLGEHAEFGLNEEDAPQQAWARYIFGVCRPQHWRAPLPLPSTTSSL